MPEDIYNLNFRNFQVVDIRNGLSHLQVKDNMYLSDKQVDDCFTDIEDCVDAIKGHQPTLKGDEIKKTLKQVSGEIIKKDFNVTSSALFVCLFVCPVFICQNTIQKCPAVYSDQKGTAATQLKVLM